MITLLKPITVTQFGKSRVINAVDVKESTANNAIKKVLVTIGNTSEDKQEFVYAERLTLWAGEKATDAPTPDPEEGSYFADADTSATGIENRIKEVLSKRN